MEPTPTPTPTPSKVFTNTIYEKVNPKRCVAKGVWVFTKSEILQVCDSKLRTVLAVQAYVGKGTKSTPIGVFRAYRFSAGPTSAKNSQKLFYSSYFYKGLAIAGVDKITKATSKSSGIFIDKKYAKQVYNFIKSYKAFIWVKPS